ncbi:glycosyltransferase family 4 protein, partial [Patescibacteria group bacterium]|nr:glycosyltransferase family 4 protein [Patescibacteria group bacterium]
MKVAFFSFLFLEYGGGFEKFFIKTALKLREYHPDLEITIVAFDEKMAIKLHFLLSFFYFYSYKKACSQWRKGDSSDLKKQLKLVKYINCSSFSQLKRELSKYDLIFSKNEILEAGIIKLILGYGNLPPIIFCCGTPIYYPIANSWRAKLHNLLYIGRFYRFLTKEAALFQVKNSLDQKKLENIFPREKIVKIYNFFDEDFLRNSEHEAVDFPSDRTKFNILWIGRLTEQKGIDKLAEIIEAVNMRGYEGMVRWNIIGGKGDDRFIIKLKENFSNIFHLNQVSTEEIASIYAANDLYISTSLWEGCPNTVLEAQALDLPVIAFNISGPNDIVLQNRTGVLVESTEEFISVVKDFIDNKYNFSGNFSVIRNKFSSKA